MTTFTHTSRQRAPRSAFTLIEMTIVMAIIAILAAMAMSVYATAASQAKEMRTRSIIAKIDQLIGEKYESYRTRQVPIKIPFGRYNNGQPYMQPYGEPFAETANDTNLTNGFRDNSEGFSDQGYNGASGNNQYDLGAAELRLLALRELQRLELPNQIADVGIDPLVMPFGPPGIVGNRIVARPAISKQYLRRAQQITGPTLAGWTGQFEGAECLYLILASSRDGEKSALDWFSPSEIGDVDNDGMNEILDAFGQPIEFVRWPAGYRADVAPFPVTPQRRNDSGLGTDPTDYPDISDPMKVDGRVRSNVFGTFALKPLIYSAGPDKQYRIGTPAIGSLNGATFLADPYHFDAAGLFAGSPNGTGWEDNITNHDLEAR